MGGMFERKDTLGSGKALEREDSKRRAYLSH
jgi:hypothetical protein